MFIYWHGSNENRLHLICYIHKQKSSGQLLHLDGLESAIQLLALVDLSDEEVSVTAVNFGVGDVDHVLVDVKIHLKKSDQFYHLIQQWMEWSGSFIAYSTLPEIVVDRVWQEF